MYQVTETSSFLHDIPVYCMCLPDQYRVHYRAHEPTGDPNQDELESGSTDTWLVPNRIQLSVMPSERKGWLLRPVTGKAAASGSPGR
jgi:hypothetical protein